ncbi:mannose-1-phosphate guanylyltransferase [Phycisphaera mikurensis]|uniref:Putative mannose-1-phosphate guanylyltransferase n=1 Tax=Phycisphaera mikurensis (strain NBRC 102666 / KCTC 22515 / FYK2301M01) TaxID=1142394 RepID=I0IID7_PHYMF|nr:sugar phosphate nucleotidyltransferase [Phycisphaera mikurensis]MBB6442411.1 mannose-1-phosphate guanylyltransferase [Phycisphaera mikurensis]BAM05025.1 putative mannose-1-phosphate guanylyltransferase [Phycisphaera mikurensis NBRC 102666]
MRHAVIMAGGSGTRLWPMSVAEQPKQLIPFIGAGVGETEPDGSPAGRSLLAIAMDRLEGLVDDGHQWVCAGEATREPMLRGLPRLDASRFIGEPIGRDTLAAVVLAAAVLKKTDPDAVMAIFTADHIIEPVADFQRIVSEGFALAESAPNTLVTFGITPTQAATGYGYLQLGAAIDATPGFTVSAFKEKPDAQTAASYLDAGSEKYLWNSGMFVWSADAVLAAAAKFAPTQTAAIQEVVQSWGTDAYGPAIAEAYPGLEKISVDFAIMEPAAADDAFRVAAVPMPLSWLDVGSWPSFAETLDPDADGNAVSGAGEGNRAAVLMDASDNLVVSDDPDHCVALLGVSDLLVVRTGKSTLVCHRDHAEKIKALQKEVADRMGDAHV